LPVRSFHAETTIGENTHGSADVLSVTGSGTEEGGKHGPQARGVCPGERLLSIPEQIYFQDFSISSNANSAVTVGS